LIGDPTYADAILDRIVHNAHRINLTGHSLRRARVNKTSKEGVPRHSGPLSKNAPPAFLRARFVDPMPGFASIPLFPAQSPATARSLRRYLRARSLAACCAQARGSSPRIDHPNNRMPQIIRQRGTGPRATSGRNTGRHHLGMPGRLHRNPHP
jgi:hypothetical protein